MNRPVGGEAAQHIGREQRGIAVEDEDFVAALHGGCAAAHGVARAEKFGLFDELHILPGEGRAHLSGFVANHHDDAFGRKPEGGAVGVEDHRRATHRVEHLGERRLHACALAGGEEDDAERVGHGVASARLAPRATK